MKTLTLMLSMLLAVVCTGQSIPLGPAFANSGTTYYVATTGSDSNSGTFASPWATVQHAADNAGAGSTVIVEDGTYAQTLNLQTSGTSTSPIVFKAQHKWGAKLNPSQTDINAIGNRIINIGASYVTVQDFEIVGTSLTAVGIKFNSGTNSVVKGNSIHDIGVNTTTCTAGAGILIGTSNNSIIGNWIYNISPPRNASVRCNLQHGIYLSEGDNGVMQNNVVFQVWQGWALQAYGGWSSWLISNNTFFNVGDDSHSSGGTFLLDCMSGTCDFNHINNNIAAFGQGGFGCFSQFQDTGSGAAFGTHNTYLNNDMYNCQSTTITYGTVSGNVTANPLFVNYTGDNTGDYRLQSSSTLIDQGNSAAAPIVDFNGTSRPLGSGYDIGAYEYIP